VHRNLSSFKAQGLSNIAWAFAMVNCKDEMLLRKVAPEIAKDASELRPLAIARCAWAYRALTVPAKELMATMASEGVQKASEFTTKALAKLVDSVYVSPSASAHAKDLESLLKGRMVELANFFRQSWDKNSPWPCIDHSAYKSRLQTYGLVDCGIVGTPMVLAQLDIGLPSVQFMRGYRVYCQRTFTAPWELAKSDGSSKKEFSFMEYELHVHGQTLGPSQALKCVQRPPPAMEHELGPPWLYGLDMPSRKISNDTVLQLLLEVCSQVQTAGLSPGDEATSGVTGRVQILSTVLPSLSSVGALYQFKILFPNVELHFVEQVGTVGDS
jgi:hypothetical protein